jgi:hypothetical protein
MRFLARQGARVSSRQSSARRCSRFASSHCRRWHGTRS